MEFGGLFKYNNNNDNADNKIFEACKIGDLLKLKEGIAEGMDPTKPGKVRSGRSINGFETIWPIHIAASNGYLDIIQFLIEYGIDPDFQDFKDMTPMCYAAQNGHLDVVQYLSDKEVAMADFYGLTPLYYAAQNGHLDVVQYLHEKGVDPNTSVSPLSHAVRRGDMNVVQYLVEVAHLDPNKPDGYGQIPIFVAIDVDKFEIFKYLCKMDNIDLEQKNKNGETLIHHAAYFGKLDIVKYLVKECKVYAFQTDEDGNTPIHTAAWTDQIDIVRYLSRYYDEDRHERGVMHAFAENKNQETVIDIAEKCESCEVYNYLDEVAESWYS